MSKPTHRLAALFALAAVVFTIGSARAEAQLFYVDAASSSPASPYAAPETAATTIADALVAAREAVVNAKTAESAEIRIIANKYTETDFALDFPVTIVGATGNPEDVEIVDAVSGKRVFTITHADAKVASITISGNGYHSGNGYGGHVYMTAGTVENCVVKGGRCTNDQPHQSGRGGNVWMSGGLLTHCWITSGVANDCYTTPGGTSSGDGVYAEGSAVIDNCLIYKNSKATNTRVNGGGAYLAGNAKMVNCTVIDNGQSGVYVAANTVKVANSVFYGNGATATANFLGQMGTYSHCAAAVTNDACATWVVLADGHFSNYAAGDYRLNASSPAVDYATDDSTWVPSMASTDLLGKDRQSGPAVDLGCYELDQSVLSVGGSAGSYASHEGDAITFHAAAKGVSPGAVVTYEWNFGDGTPAGTTTSPTAQHAYVDAGLYVAKVRASADDGANWSDWFVLTTKFVVAPTTMFVDSKCAKPTFPYKTKETASLSFADVFNALTNNVSGGKPCLGGLEIRVCKGTHALTGVTLDRDISVIGDTGNPEDVEIVDAVTGQSAFTITHADAKVADLTISGSGCHSGNAEGGHVHMTAGAVRNCIVKGGRATGDQPHQIGYGGNVWMSGGLLTHCRITAGIANNCASPNGYSYGDGIYAKGTAAIDNCLVFKNSRTTGSKVYGGGVYLTGDAKMVNCTVVDNYQGGVYPAVKTAKIVNSIFYGNGATAEANFANGVFSNYICCASSVTNEHCASWFVMAESDFYDYFVSDYHHGVDSTLLDVGTQDAELLPTPASTTDLDGLKRVSGPGIDLGCYEVDQSKVTFNGGPRSFSSFEGSNLVFTVSAKGGESTAYLYKWDFGDGQIIETSEAVYTKVYSEGGDYAISLTVSADGGSTWMDWLVLSQPVHVSPKTVYVDSSCANPIFPYRTRETAALTIADALNVYTNAFSGGKTAIDDVEVRIYPGATGKYTETGFTLASGVTVRGMGETPADVEIVDAVVNQKAFTITHADAKVVSLTISGTGAHGGNAFGGHVNMTAGTIENCVIKGGRCTNNQPHESGRGGNIYMTGGLLTHCWITDGIANDCYTNPNGYSYGDGIYAEGSAIIDNCLIYKNSKATNTRVNGGGAYLAGNAKMVNCTVVDNGQSGVYVASANVRIVNTVLLGNGATDVSNFTGTVADGFAYCASTVTNDACASWFLISDTDFAAYLSGNYRPSTTSRFLDIGTQDTALVPQPAATVDLDGFKRKSGPGIDLGCYELDQSVVTCSGYPLEYYAFETSNLVFHAAAKGGDSTDYTFRWDFGNGVTNLTKSGDYGYNYPSGGLFHIRLSASADDGVTWSEWYEVEKSIMVTPKVIYVDSASAAPAAPYRTRETAATTIVDALNTLTNQLSGGQTAMNGVEIQVYPGATGKYAETGFTLASGVTVRGMGETPEDVEIVDAVNGKRAFTITHADAKVASLTISGRGYHSGNGNGGHVYMTAGTVENCVIKGGRCTTDQPHESGRGGNVWMSGGLLTHCWITSGVANDCYTNPGGTSSGDGVYAEGSAVIDNCLIYKNSKATNTRVNGGGAYLAGNARMVNCTVIDNGQSGVYVAANTVKVANSVFYGNGATATANFLGQMGTYSHCAAAATNASCATWLVIQNGDFAGYLAGDYHLSAATALIDAGTRDEAWVPAPQATEDLDGLMRVSGAEIDIGCYEFDLSKVSVGGYASTYAAFEASNVVFHASARGGVGVGFEYQWDFGNGTIITTDQADYSYAYPTSGLFRVRVSAREHGSSEWSSWFVPTEKMVVAPQVMYVDSKCEKPTFPYKTKATAALKFVDVFNALTNNVSGGRPALGGVKIVVCVGSHTDTGVLLDKAVVIEGETGDPKDVEIVDQVTGKRCFTITHADAVVRNLTISGKGYHYDFGTGGHINMTMGLVENCVIKNGQAAGGEPHQSGKGGNVWMSGGRMLRCRIMGGIANYGNYGVPNGVSAGSGLYAEGGAIVENCLLCDNSRLDKVRGNGGAAYLTGQAKMVNCTVVSNVFSGVYLASANAQVVNTVLFGNGGTLEKEFGDNGRTNQFSHCASTMANGGDPDGCVIDEKAFWHYDRREEDVKFLRAASGSKLISGGTKWAEYEATGAISTRDLLGNPRLIGKRLDIGAFEGAVSGMAVRIK